MQIVQLVYASRAHKSMGPAEVKDILAVSRKNNERDLVTGALFFSSRYFLQCLEGSRKQVNETYRRILGDERHHESALLWYQEVHERRFPSWSMGYVGEGISNRDIFLRFGAFDQFDPFSLTGEAARNLLMELARQ